MPVNELHCDECNRDFVNYHASDQHRNAVGHWECEVCHELYWNEDAANSHMENMDHRKSRYCFDCSRGFMNENNYRQHRNSRLHRGTDIQCPFCKTAFTTASGVSHHLERGACPKARNLDRNTIYTELRRRDPGGVVTNKLLEWHGDATYEASSRTWNGSGFQCYICHQEFKSLTGLNQHLNSPRHASKLYHCPSSVCAKQFTSLAALFNHLESETCGYCRFDHVQRNVGNFLSGKNLLTFG